METELRQFSSVRRQLKNTSYYLFKYATSCISSRLDELQTKVNAAQIYHQKDV